MTQIYRNAVDGQAVEPVKFMGAYIPVSTHTRLKILATERQTSISAVVGQAIDLFLSEVDKNSQSL